MRIPLWAPALAMALLAAGCAAERPRAEDSAPPGQKTARAVHHWDVLADDVAARMAEKMRAWPAGAHPIYVSPAGETSFNAGFRKLLITRLLDRGIALSTVHTEVEMKFDTQLVPHTAGVAWTPIAPDVAVARDPYGEAGGAAAHANAVAAAEGAGSTRFEVLVTTSIESGGRYLAGTADVYSVAQGDTALYQPRAPQAAATKTWRVVAP